MVGQVIFTEKKVLEYAYALINEFADITRKYKVIEKNMVIKRRINIDDVLDLLLSIENFLILLSISIMDASLQDAIDNTIEKVREMTQELRNNTKISRKQLVDLIDDVRKYLQQSRIAELVVSLSSPEERVDESLQRKYKL